MESSLGAFSMPNAGSRADRGNVLACRLILCLWFLFLFEPFRLISYYAHALSPLKWIPELLLYGTSVLWVLSPGPKRHLKWFTAFFGLTVLGTVIAFLFGNWGIARLIVRQMFQYYALGVLTLTFCNSPQRANTILRIYLLSFLYYGIWGLISLRLAPIADSADPGAREIVFWHIHFVNRDGFGPLMVMGFGLSFYLYKASMSRLWKLLIAFSLTLCFLGIVISFGRGVFLAFLAVIGYIWFKTRHKVLGVVALAMMIVAFVLSAPEFASRYWATMQTIFSQGTRAGTGLDRKILWGWAWREFLHSPIFGVGTGNFGIAVFRVVSPSEIVSSGYTTGSLWGRVLHCAPMTVLCEYGLVGAGVALCLVRDFIRTNRRTRVFAARLADPTETGNHRDDFFSQPSHVVAVSNGLIVAFVATLICAFFYELLYTPLLWHIIVINRLVYLAVLQAAPDDEPRLA